MEEDKIEDGAGETLVPNLYRKVAIRCAVMGLSKSAAAERAGVKASVFSAWSRADRPTLRTLGRLAKVLELDVQVLLVPEIDGRILEGWETFVEDAADE